MRAALTIVIVSNDVIPEMGLPVSASGMRATGLAAGLRAHGFDVIITVPRHRVEQMYRSRPAKTSVPDGSIVLRYNLLRTFLDTIRPIATIICNSNYFHEISGAATGKLIFDFFAPKYLEAEAEGQGPDSLLALSERKRAALGAAHAVIVNGDKKLDYVRDWLRSSNPSGSEVPIALANMCYKWPRREVEPKAGAFSIVVAGYYQRWLDYGETFSELARALDAIPELGLTLLVPRLNDEIIGTIPGLAACVAHPRTRVRRTMLLADYLRLLQANDIFVDVFRPTEERRLAMVTRSVVGLGVGVPVVHPDFTEVSRIIGRTASGWLLDEAGTTTLYDLLCRLSQDPAEVAARALAARSLGSTEFDPAIATRPLAELIGELL